MGSCCFSSGTSRSHRQAGAAESSTGRKHESLNAQLAPYAAKIVTVGGTIVSKKGANVIENARLVSEEALWQRIRLSMLGSRSPPGIVTGFRMIF